MRWFEDWKVEEKPLRTRDDRELVGIWVTVTLPNSRTSQKKWSHLFSKSEISKARKLTGILMAAFDQIQKDNGGYKK